jgi:hypothetical protein
MSGCAEWRPLAMKGICECGQRWHQHSDAVRLRQVEALLAQSEAENARLVASINQPA